VLGLRGVEPEERALMRRQHRELSLDSVNHLNGE
jgi:hypothetical protein